MKYSKTGSVKRARSKAAIAYHKVRDAAAHLEMSSLADTSLDGLARRIDNVERSLKESVDILDQIIARHEEAAGR